MSVVGCNAAVLLVLIGWNTNLISAMVCTEVSLVLTGARVQQPNRRRRKHPPVRPQKSHSSHRQLSRRKEMTHRRRSEGDGWRGSLKGVEWEWECIYFVLHSPLKFSMYLVPPFVCPKGSCLFFSFFLVFSIVE